MTVRIRRGDTILEADTQEEIAFLLRLLGLNNGHIGIQAVPPQQQIPLPLSQTSSHDAYSRVLQRLGHESQQAVLRILAQSATPVRDAHLAEKLGVKNTVAVSGVLTGIKKQAKKEGLSPADLFVQTGESGDYKFTLTPKLREAVLRAISESERGNKP